MKFHKIASISILASILCLLICQVQNSTGLPNEESDNLSNADLNHLLSLLDDENGEAKELKTPSIDTQPQKLSSKDGDDSPRVPKMMPTTPSKTPTTPVSPTIINPVKKSGVIVKKVWKKIRKPKPTDPTVSITTTTTALPAEVTVQIVDEESIPMTSVQRPTESYFDIPAAEQTPIQRREDTHIENLKNIAPPSQQELVQQLSLLNSLLTSLGENSTAKSSGNDTKKVVVTSTSTSTSTKKDISSDPTRSTKQADKQSLAMLNALMMAASGGGSNPVDAAALSALLSALGGINNNGQASEESSALPEKPSPSTPSMSGLSDTEATAAITEFLKQAATIENQQKNGGNKLENFNGNLNDAAATSNQISSLLNLIGSLNSLQQQAATAQQQQNPLNFAPQENAQLNPVNSNQINANTLMTLIGNQRGQRQNQISAESLNELFNPKPVQQSQGINLGTLLASASQNAATSGLPGLGNGIFSSLGTLGSSIFSSVSNIFGSNGGKPDVRGMDTRLGLGYRFGDAADAQIMWDVGPQLFTDSIQNEFRHSGKTNKDHYNAEQSLNTQSRAEKQLQEVVAAKRQLQNQMEHDMQNHHLYQRSFSLEIPEATKKSLSLMDIWNAGKEKVISVKNTLFSENPFGLLMPPVETTAPSMTIPFDEVDLHQMAREKNMLKRSSAGSYRRRSKPSAPYYDKPADDPTSGHSTLTNYEKMLLSHGKDMGVNYQEQVTEESVNRPVHHHRRPSSSGNKWGRRRPMPRPIKPVRRKRPPTPISLLSSESFPEEYAVETDYLKEEQPTVSSRPRNPSSREREHHRPNSKPKPRRPSIFNLWNKDKKPRRPSSSKRQKERPETEPYEDPDYVEYQGKPPAKQENKRPKFNRNRPNKNKYENSNDFNRRPPQFNDDEKVVDDYNDDATRRPPHKDDYKQEDHTYRNSPQDSNYNEDDHDDDTYPTSSSKRRPNSRPGNKNKNNDDSSGHYSEDRPKPSRPSKQRNRPTSNPNKKKRRNSGFSLSKIFNMFRRRPAAAENKRRRNDNRPSPISTIPITANRRNDFYKETSFDDDPFDSFTDKQDDLIMSDSNDRFYARNSFNSEDPMDSFMSRKSSRPYHYYPRRRTGNGGNRQGLPLHEIYEASDPEEEANPEANDSFIRRNAVAVNPKLRDIEKEKLLRGDAYNATNSRPPHGGQRKSVMSFVRNYLSKKSPTANNKSSNKTSSGHSTMSTLTKLLSNPSALSPLMILPIRRRNKRPQNDTETKKPNTKLALIDGELKILNSTTSSEEEKDKPIVHVGEDMSFEELSKVFGAIKSKANKGKKKLKIKVKKPDEIRVIDEEEEFLDDDEELTKAEEKVDKGKSHLILAASDNEADEEYDDEEDQEAENDDVKGIFIDIESGEVNVMKPVASLTSFEPKKEPSEEEIDDYEDVDGDGIADADMKRKQDIFSGIQKELKRNFNKMKKAQEKAEAKQRRKEALAEKGMDESVDVVSKYFDMIDDDKSKSL